MTDEYVPCLVSYNGDVNDVQTDGTAFVEADTIYHQMEELRWEGVVKDVVYGNALRDTDRNQAVPLPVSFKLREDYAAQDTVPEMPFAAGGLDAADRWTWEPVDPDAITELRRKQAREAGYELFQSTDIEYEVHTRNPETADHLDSIDTMEPITE